MNVKENITQIPLQFDEMNKKYTLLLTNSANWTILNENQFVVNLDVLKEQLDSLCDYIIDGDFFEEYAQLDIQTYGLELTIEFAYKITNEVIALLEYYQQKLQTRNVSLVIIAERVEK